MEMKAPERETTPQAAGSSPAGGANRRTSGKANAFLDPQRGRVPARYGKSKALGILTGAQKPGGEVVVAGRKRKYGTAKSLEKAVDAYFAAISYEVPAVVATPTGEVDQDGRVKWKTVLLREKTDDPGVGGKPITETKWIRPPSMAGLMLHLGVSKETWSGYSRLDGYKDVVERARARMEDYWASRLDGKGARGAKFALNCCYGWREGGDGSGEREWEVQIIDDL